MKQSGFDIRKANMSDANDMLSCIEPAYHQYISVIGKKHGPMLDNVAGHNDFLGRGVGSELVMFAEEEA